MKQEPISRKILCDIAQCTFEVVNRLLLRDQQYAHELRSSTTSSRQIVGEETITEELAMELRERFPLYVELTLFTHPEETQTGADWYWRFERGDYSIHAFVQAKRVKRGAFGESDALGHIDIDFPQLERLLQLTHITAQRILGLEAWFATYARFNATPPCGCFDLQDCNRHRHVSNCGKHQPSLWIANAQEIANVKRRQIPIEQIVEHSVRLDCVLPCIDILGASGPSMKGFVLQSGLQSYQECVLTIERDSLLRSELRGALRIHQTAIS